MADVVSLGSVREETHKASIGWLTTAERDRALRYLSLGYSAERVADLQGIPVVAVKALKARDWLL